MQRLVSFLVLALSSVAVHASAQEAPLLIVPTPAADEVTTAMANAAAERIAPLLVGRQAVVRSELSANVAACADAACYASQSAGSAMLVIAHEENFIALQLLGPSGAPLTSGARTELAGDATDVERVLNGATLGRLAGAIPAPPRRAPLLITTNVDGATVTLNGQSAGTTPMAALAADLGDYTIEVQAQGYAPYSQTISLSEVGARVDAWLEPSAETAASMQREDADEAGTFTTASDDPIHEKWWFWAAVGGGAVVVAGVITAIAIASGGEDDTPDIVAVPPIPTP